MLSGPVVAAGPAPAHRVAPALPRPPLLPPARPPAPPGAAGGGRPAKAPRGPSPCAAGCTPAPASTIPALLTPERCSVVDPSPTSASTTAGPAPPASGDDTATQCRPWRTPPAPAG